MYSCENRVTAITEKTFRNVNGSYASRIIIILLIVKDSETSVHIGSMETDIAILKNCAYSIFH